MYKHFFKRVIDFIIALFALLIIWPFLLIIFIWLTIANKGAGAFFLQERPGLHGKIFKVIKFKTMTDERDENGKLLPDAQRITKVGRFVRSTSIDELPQLFNVLKGDMSLVGTRPPTVEEYEQYSDHHKKRLATKPGITGMWQVSGRSDITDFEEIVKLDTKYIADWSLWLDIRILIKTVFVVLKHDGAR